MHVSDQSQVLGQTGGNNQGCELIPICLLE